MGKLDSVLYRKSMDLLVQEGIEREFGERLFTDWRDRYIAKLCNHIRLCREATEAGLSIAPYPPEPQWCNAAVQILTHGDLMTQDYFMRADENVKDELVRAVIHDQGVTDLRGQFAELPPL